MGLGPAQAERGWWRRFSPERACAARECAIAFLHSFPRLDPEPYVDPFARYNQRPHKYDESSIEHGPYDYRQPTGGYDGRSHDDGQPTWGYDGRPHDDG